MIRRVLDHYRRAERFIVRHNEAHLVITTVTIMTSAVVVFVGAVLLCRAIYPEATVPVLVVVVALMAPYVSAVGRRKPKKHNGKGGRW